jgi:hypothetical protein
LPFLPAADNTARPRGNKPVWTVAQAICHRAIEDYPDDATSQVDWFKAQCGRLGIDPYAPGGPDQRPLYARVFDFVLEQRARRQGAGRR